MKLTKKNLPGPSLCLFSCWKRKKYYLCYLIWYTANIFFTNKMTHNDHMEIKAAAILNSYRLVLFNCHVCFYISGTKLNP